MGGGLFDWGKSFLQSHELVLNDHFVHVTHTNSLHLSNQVWVRFEEELNIDVGGLVSVSEDGNEWLDSFDQKLRL